MSVEPQLELRDASHFEGENAGVIHAQTARSNRPSSNPRTGNILSPSRSDGPMNSSVTPIGLTTLSPSPVLFRRQPSPHVIQVINNTNTTAAITTTNNNQTPTRTLRITEAEQQQSRDTSSTPLAQRAVTVLTRPRSNQRTRAPMRYESPLDPHEFRRVNTGSYVDNGRITIRPMAGAAVGVVAPTLRIGEEISSRKGTVYCKMKSSKQGPSHRKIRRWNNDSFSALAAEIANSSRATANVLMQAQNDAHLYRSIYDPTEHRSEKVQEFMEGPQWKSLRERFFEGETPLPCPSLSDNSPRAAAVVVVASPEQRLLRIDPRLRRVVIKACTNSYPAALVVQRLERFVVRAFASNTSSIRTMKQSTAAKADHIIDDNDNEDNGDRWWADLLLEYPTVTKHKTRLSSPYHESSHFASKANNTVEGTSLVSVQFFFHATDSKGGFHRLLLHAICQFYGLHAVSQMLDLVRSGDERSTKTRSLLVTGYTRSGEEQLGLLETIMPQPESTFVDGIVNKDGEESSGTSSSWLLV